MANRLKMAKINAILTLHQQGWSQRRIAEQLGIHRETVARYVSDESKSTEAPTGSDIQNRPQARTGSEACFALLGKQAVAHYAVNHPE